MPALSPTFLLVAALVLLFSYLNGVTGSASLIAPVLSTRALGPRQAVGLVTLILCAAPFLLGVAVARSFVLNHIIHHRAQYGVYLRLNNIPIPGSYGPSADETGM